MEIGWRWQDRTFFCMPKWIWPSINRYRRFHLVTSTLPPCMHHKLTKIRRFCKQKKELPTKLMFNYRITLISKNLPGNCCSHCLICPFDQHAQNHVRLSDVGCTDSSAFLYTFHYTINHFSLWDIHTLPDINYSKTWKFRFWAYSLFKKLLSTIFWRKIGIWAQEDHLGV